MSITATCSACGRKFIAPPQFQGKRVKCKGCGEIFQIPRAVAKAPSAPSPLKSPAAPVAAEDNFDTDPLAQPGAVATSDSHPGSGEFHPSEPGESPPAQSPELQSEPDRKTLAGLTPNVLTFNYPGSSDIDQWLPVTLVVLGFLLLLAGINTSAAHGIGWIAFTRFLTPVFFYVAFIFPVTLGMLRKAARELRYAMPPNYQLRCLASYMPAFVILGWLQLGGDGFSVIQLFAGLVGIAISSAVLWLLFRLREENIGTTVVYGAGGFAAAAAITVALTIGLNKMGALVVTSSHAESSVPVSPFGEGLSWVSTPPAPPIAKIAPPVAPVATDSSNTPSASAGIMGQFDPQTLPVDADEIIDPLTSSPSVAVLHKDQDAVTIQSWNSETWKSLPGTLRLPARPAGKMVLSNDGDQLAWIAEFPRLSVQVWSFSKSSVINSVQLDAAQGRADLIGFVGPDLLLVDRTLPKTVPVTVQQPATPADNTPPPPAAAAPDKPGNMFDDMAYNPKRLAEEANRPANAAPPNNTPAPDAQANAQPTTGPAAVAAAGNLQHQFSVINSSSNATVCTFTLPPLAADPSAGALADSMRVGQNVAISTDSNRLIAATKKDGTPTLVQIDLMTGKSLGEIPVAEIDPTLSGSPTGLAFSNDGINLAALFENGGSALLLAYNTNTGKKISTFVYPAGPLEGATHAPFQGSALCWLDPMPAWLVYGQAILSTQTGNHLKAADISLADPSQQRYTQDDRLELVTPIATGKRLTILKIDRTKLEAALDAAAPPAPAP